MGNSPAWNTCSVINTALFRLGTLILRISSWHLPFDLVGMVSRPSGWVSPFYQDCVEAIPSRTVEAFNVHLFLGFVFIPGVRILVSGCNSCCTNWRIVYVFPSTLSSIVPAVSQSLRNWAYNSICTMQLKFFQITNVMTMIILICNRLHAGSWFGRV